MQRSERMALGTLFAITILGHGLRLLAMAPADAPGSFTLLSGPGPADVAAHRARSARAGRPLAPGETIDLNTASAADLARVPGLGPRLAQAIIRERNQSGGFLSTADLDRIEGVGPRLLAALGPRARFGDTARVRARRPAQEAPPNQVQAREAEAPSGRSPLVLVPGTRRKGGAAKGVSGSPVHLNSATQAELETLPGVGPTKARAILAYRQSNGPFAAVSDLGKVPGFTARLVTQLAPQVVIP